MGLTINATFDQSVTSLQTSDPTLYTNYTNSVNAAVAYFDSQITNNITININFGWGEVAGSPIDPGASGESSSYYDTFTYGQVLAGLQATDTTSAVQTAAVASLPSSDPTNGAVFKVNYAEELALGLTGGNATSASLDGSVGLDATGTTWTWAGGTYTANSEDAVGTLEHEISEVLGRSATGGANSAYRVLDMFRYTAANGLADDAIGSAAGVRDQPFVAGYNANAPSYFSYNGSTVTLLYETPADVAGGADVADWAPAVGQDSFADGGDGAATPVSTTDLQELNVLGYSLACYVSGTRIRTDAGDVAIENLAVGDLVVTASGKCRPIVWIGRRKLDLRKHRDPKTVWPVRVTRDAFGEGLPHRELWLSPGHNIAFDGVLTPISALVNGASIAQIPRDTVEYWHVELEAHDVLYAEGLPSETYLDCGNRAAFENGGVFIEAHPDFEPKHWRETCLPLVKDGDAVVAARRHLFAQLVEQGTEIVEDADVHLLADGLRVEPLWLASGKLAFVLPLGCQVVRLQSLTFVPAHSCLDNVDPRELGICVKRLQIDGDEVALDDARLDTGGWHECEHGEIGVARRWTRGSSLLISRARIVVIELGGRGYYWRGADVGGKRLEAQRA